MSEKFDQLIEQAYQHYQGPANMRSKALTCIKAGIRMMDLILPGKTAAFVGKNFFTPRRYPVRDSDKQIVQQAKSVDRMTLSNGKQATIYHWGDSGPKVLLAHGWESRASHFSRLIGQLVEQGFQVVAFDAPAHGNSSGEQSSIVEFIEIVQHLEKQEGGFDGVIAHSFGGLSVINAVKAGFRTKVLLIVSAPTHFNGLVIKYASILNLPERQQQRLRDYIERYFGMGDKVWQQFNAYNGLYGIDQPAIIIHDDSDDVVLKVEAECLAKAWPGACLATTAGLGHNPLRRNGRGIDLVLEHLQTLQTTKVKKVAPATV